MGAITIGKNGWLEGAGIVHVPSRRQSVLATPSGRIEGVVSHWTATARGTAANLARRIVDLPAEGEALASWHVCIEHDGQIYQSVPLTKGSWHAGHKMAAKFKRAGNGIWAPAKAGGVTANRWALGIEMVSVGEVRMVGGEWRGWPYKIATPAVPKSETAEHAATGRRYHAFTEQQEAAWIRIWDALRAEWGILPRNAEWGHSQIDPTRKTDPGPIWLARVKEIVK